MKTKLTPKQILDTLTIQKYVNDEVVNSMPTDMGEEKIELFNIGNYISNSELIKEYESRGLVPAYPAHVIDEYKDSQPQKFIATIWDYKDGITSYLAFDRWRGDERSVSVNRDDDGWADGWWFAGVRKSSKLGDSELKPSVPLNLSLLITKLTYAEEAIKEVRKVLEEFKK